jgi:hypothetical protein
VQWFQFQGKRTIEEQMQIQVHTDSNIEGREKLMVHVQGVVESTLSRFRERVTRVGVHLGDENGHKAGQDDKRCMMECRIEGHQPMAVTHHAANLDQAINGAADKLVRVIESTLGRLHDHR